jgi:hypothetical protein
LVSDEKAGTERDGGKAEQGDEEREGIHFVKMLRSMATVTATTETVMQTMVTTDRPLKTVSRVIVCASC